MCDFLYFILQEQEEEAADHHICCGLATGIQTLCNGNQSLKSSGSEIPSGSLITADL